MKDSNKEHLYVWACDFSKSRGEGLLARNFVFNCSKNTQKKILVNGINYSILKKKNTHFETNFLNNYIFPLVGVFKIWKEHLTNKKTIYLNYLPLWNFFIFLFLPKKTVLGPITGGSSYSKSYTFNYYIRKLLFPILFRFSLKIISNKFDKIIFSTDLLKKYISNNKNFTFNYCLNIYDKKILKQKKKYDLIFYYRKNKNKNNYIQKKLIKKLIDYKYKVIVVGDNPLLENCAYRGNLERDKVLDHISKSKFAVNNNENKYSLFCLDSLSCGTNVIYFGRKNNKNNFFTNGSIVHKDINNVDKQFNFIKKILKNKIRSNIKVNKNFLLNKKKINNYFLKLEL